MTVKTTPLVLVTSLLISTIAPQNVFAEKSNDALKKAVLSADGIFWNAYNTCKVKSMSDYLSKDVEFYHDKHGLTSTEAELTKSIQGNLCSGSNRVRREVVKDSLKFYPLNNYGGILSGEHVFYVYEEGKEEHLDGIAKFTHVWKNTGDELKMTRILSYDHKAISRLDTSTVNLPAETFAMYIGKYSGPQTGNIKIGLTPQGDSLTMAAEGIFLNIHPESSSLFFSKEMPLTFEFVKGSNSHVIKMIVRENGSIVEEAKRIN